MLNASAEQRLCLYSAVELQSVLQRMAQQADGLLPATGGVLIGIQRRGEPLAHLLQHYLKQFHGRAELPLYALKVQRYADDLRILHADTNLSENPKLATLDLRSNTLLVIDDVLYEGHSLLRTCAYLAQLGAGCIRTAVLVDRCTCTQPVHADITGIRLQIAPGDIVECHVPPFEPHLAVEVVRRNR